MLVIKIDEEYTPELRDAVMKLIGQFNVVSFSVDDAEQGQYTVDPKLRASSDSEELGAALSAAVDRVRRRQNGR